MAFIDGGQHAREQVDRLEKRNLQLEVEKLRQWLKRAAPDQADREAIHAYFLHLRMRNEWPPLEEKTSSGGA